MTQNNKPVFEWAKKICCMVATMMFIVVATCLLAACSDDDGGLKEEPFDPAYAESRTVLVYMVAENSLASVVTSDVNEMLRGAKTEGLRKGDKLVLYIDDTSLPRFYVVDRNTTAFTLSDLTPVETYSEDVNSASPEQLAAAFDFVQKHYPADSYGLVMWSHGSGWIPSTFEGDRKDTYVMPYAFGFDNGRNVGTNSGGGYQMEICDMARVIEEKGGVDVILFDGCSMQSFEVAYELRNATKYIVGSPAEVPFPGADYSTMVPAMFKISGYANDMLQAFYDYYVMNATGYGIIVSSVETSGLEGFAAYMRSVVAKYRESLLNANYGSRLNYFEFPSWSTQSPDMYDAQGLMQMVMSEEDLNDWKAEIAKIVVRKHSGSWYSAYNRRSNRIDDEQCCGFSMFIPLTKYDGRSFKEAFFDTEWAKAVWTDNE